MFDKIVFGKRVKYYRGLRGLTILELCEKADISMNHLSRIESGKHVPTLEMMLKIMNALNVSYTNLMENSDDEELLLNSVLECLKYLSDSETTFMIKIMDRLQR